MLLRSHGSSSSSELLPDDLVELILEHVPVMPLLRFRSQLRGPDVLILSHSTLSLEDEPLDDRIFGLGTSIVWTVKLPNTCDMYCHGTACESCDGLFCTFGIYSPSVVANPATGWYRILPLSNYQHLCQTYMREGYVDFPGLGFVFDFTTKAWRYVVPSSPYLIWSFDPSGKTWKTICSLDLIKRCWHRSEFPLLPIAILNKGWLLLRGGTCMDPLMIYDLHTKSYDLFFQPDIGPVGCVYYFMSLLSASSN
ncbi:hypothetical protein HID58_038835 [Brassica napus]|uniref:Uncharacterized protein n=1 Tax=Brassica napus TaxID=3708 RepID=A0ABQ8BQM0_BRANA|nr:hypothetical protein HID58_038835 [Brassica napus]